MKKSTAKQLFAAMLSAAVLSTAAAAYEVTLIDRDGQSVTKTGTDGTQLNLDNYLVDTEKGEWLVGWETADGNFIGGTHIKPVGQMTLTARWDPMSKLSETSGVNVFENGTFETGKGLDTRFSNGYAEIVTDPQNPENTCMYYYRGSGYAKVEHFVEWEKGRPYAFSADFLDDKGAGFCFCKYSSIGQETPNIIWQTGTTANAWTHITYTYTPSFTPTETHENDFVCVYINQGDKTNDIYVDNISFIPYNKIVYDAGEGTGAPNPAYQLGGIYEVNSTVEPILRGMKFVGWTDSPEGGTALSNIALGKGDVTLYAMYEIDENFNPIIYEPKDATAGLLDGMLYVYSDEDATADLYYVRGDEKEYFATVDIEEGVGTYVFSAGTLLPNGVTGFAAELSDGFHTVGYPAAKQPDSSKYTVVFRDGESISVSYVTPGSKVTLEEYKTRTVEGGSEYQLGWQEKDGAALYATFMYPDHSMVLDKVWAPIEMATPGVNVFRNGDFENGNTIDLRPSNGPIFIETEPNGNHMIRYNRGSGYASIQHVVGFEAGRTYKIGFRVKTEVPIYVNYNPRYNNADHAYSACSTKAGEWSAFEKTWTAPTDYTTLLATDFMSFYGNPYNGGACDMWFDDLYVIPYALITYDAGEGTGAPASESLPGGRYTVSKTEPVRRGYYFVGWALEENGEPISVIESVEGDITLYAVWEEADEQELIKYEFADTRKGIADGKITMMLPADAPDYTDVTLYYANDNGILPDYTELAALKVVGGAAVLNITGSHVLPKGATKIIATFTGAGLDAMTAEYTIPTAHRFDTTKEPKFTYYQVSDPHCGGDYWGTNPINRNNAVKDIIAMDADFVTIGGDLVNNSVTSNFTAFDNFIKTNFNDKAIPAFIVNGNHEFHVSDSPSTSYDRTSLLSTYAKQFAVNESMGYTVNRPDPEGLYYSVTIEGCKFIFLACPQPIKDYNIDDAQLKFLDEELYDCEKSNKPAFIVSHVGFGNLIPHGGSGITNPAAVEAVLARHPNVLYASGHTHSDLSENRIGENTQYVRVGDMRETFSHLNDGCMIWLEVPKSDKYPDGYKKEYSVGFRVEVYDDKILLEGREFLNESKYISYCMYQIDIPDADIDIPDVWMDGELVENETMTAVVDGVNAPGGYSYEWIVGGQVVGTSGTYTIHKDSSFGGQKLVLRVTDNANGTYASALSEATFDSVRVFYDANGGTGSVPAPQYASPFADYIPLGNGDYPSKSGKFFLGWAAGSDAEAPDHSVYVRDEDITLYAVYGDKPEFWFDYTIAPFKKNSFSVAEITEDGKLHVVSTQNDPIMNGNSVKFSADANTYCRVKFKTTSGSTDGFFFITDTSTSWAENKHLNFTAKNGLEMQKFTTSDGYSVREYDMTKLFPDFWNGTVTNVRFDVLAGPGEGYVDYLVFTDKKAIFDGSVNIAFGSDTATVPAGAHYTVRSVTWGGDNVEITLIPDEGYEFSTNEDMTALTKVNGEDVIGAEVITEEIGDGSEIGDLRINAIVTPIIVFDDGGLIIPADLSDKEYENPVTLVAALYDEDGRMTAVRTVENFACMAGVNVSLGDYAADADLLRLFFLDGETLTPVVTPYEYNLGNLIRNGDAEKDGCTFGNVSDQIGKVTVSILSDEDNRFFAIRPNNNSQQWAYASYDDITYEAGRTYQVDLDIRLVTQGTNTDPGADFTATINNNIVYADTTADHVKGAKTLKVSDGWQHVSYNFTIPANSTDRSKDAYRVYSNPVSEIAVGFDIDNIVVKPLA